MRVGFDLKFRTTIEQSIHDKPLNISAMVLLKTVEETKNYRILEASYKETIQTFRHWSNGDVEIRFNDEFAKANGYRSIADFLRKEPEIKEICIYAQGVIPEWLSIVEGKFGIKNFNSN